MTTPHQVCWRSGTPRRALYALVLLGCLLALTTSHAPLQAQQGVTGRQIPSNESDGLYNANAEESDTFAMSQFIVQGLTLKTFSVHVIASGSPTTCTWNLACTNKIPSAGDPIAAGDFNTIGEVDGSPSDLSCLSNNPQRLTQFANRTFRMCKAQLVTIGGGTTPAVKFFITGNSN